MSMITKIVSLILSFTQMLCVLIEIPRPHTIGVDTAVRYQTSEGFGTSAAWWAQHIDDDSTAKEIAELLFNKETGLGLDVFRYNVGAGERENPSSVINGDYTKTDSFYVLNEQTGEYEFDFSRDANARRVMDYALENGATSIILFCNSPHFSMTENGLGSGSTEEGHCNLPKENYQKFVDYLLTIADRFTELGYPVTYISPINEPQWNWGTGYVGQEGCHYSADEAVELLELFAVTMKERNTPYSLSGIETGDMSQAHSEYQEKFFASKILTDYCDTFSGHSYWIASQEDKQAIGKRYKQISHGTRFVMSEWCELPQTLNPTTIDSALCMAETVWGDLTLLNAVSWQSWAAVNGDGLLCLDNGEVNTFMRYYAFKQFAAFIPTGSVRVKTTDSLRDKSTLNAVAYDTGDSVVLVVINSTEEAESIVLNGGFVSAEIYVTDEEKRCEKAFDKEFTGNVTFGAKSITTLVLK